jgi:hypothetical protein
VAVREDLPHSVQVVQACHAVIELAQAGMIPLAAEHPHLVVCGVPDEKSLESAFLRASEAGIAYKSFRDDDLGEQLTALASEPVSGHRRAAFKRLQCLRGR